MTRLENRRRRTWRVWALASALAIGAGSFSAVARGDDISQEDRTRARAAFQAGLALETASDWGKALQKFQEAAAVKGTPQILFHQGRCLEHLGRWTEALGMYRMAVDRADEPKLEDVRKEADAARTSLEARLPKLTIRLGSDAAGATVSLDGVALGSTSLGTPMSVDPGTHRVSARLPGRQDPILQQISVAEGERKDLTIKAKEEQAAAPPTTPAPAADTQPGKPWLGIPKRTGYIIAGAGAASVIVGGVFYYLRQGTINDLEGACLASHCPAATESKANRGKLYTNLGNGFFILGVAGGAFGTFVIFKGKPDAAPTGAALTAPRQVNLAFGAGQDALGANVSGVF